MGSYLPPKSYQKFRWPWFYSATQNWSQVLNGVFERENIDVKFYFDEGAPRSSPKLFTYIIINRSTCKSHYED